MDLFFPFCAFFLATLPGSPFFVNFGLLSSAKTSVEVDTRETLQNKGFWSHFASLYLFDPFWSFEKASFCGPVLRIIFSVCYYFVRFDVRVFVEIGFQWSKNPWGCRTELVLKRVFFAVCPLRAQIWRAGGARRCLFFSWLLGAHQKWACRCGAEGFSVFCGFFLFDPVFENLKWSSSHPPLFLWVFFSFGCILLGIGGNAALHLCFWAVGLQPFFFFWGLLRKALFFPLKKGYLGSFLSVSLLCLPFVLLGFFHFSLSLSFSFSLSLSLSFFLLYCFFVPFLVVLFLFLPSLFFGVFSCLVLRFCFMKRTTSKYYM